MHCYQNLHPSVQKHLIFRCYCLLVLIVSIVYNAVMIGLPDMSHLHGVFYIYLLSINVPSLLLNLILVCKLIYENKTKWSTLMVVGEITLGGLYVYITIFYLITIIQMPDSFVWTEFLIVSFYAIIYYGLIMAILIIGLKILAVALYQKLMNLLNVIQTRQEEQPSVA